MLVHNVSDLVQSTPGATRTLAIQDPGASLGPELVLAIPVEGQARLHRTQSGVVVQCEITTAFNSECSRCLDPVTLPVTVRFTEEFRIAEEEPTTEQEADDFRIDEHHNLDLTEAARQYLTVALPLAPLCRPDCPGLCPDCGAPLDGHICSAVLSPSGPFAALANMLESGPPSSSGGLGPESRTIPLR